MHDMFDTRLCRYVRGIVEQQVFIYISEYVGEQSMIQCVGFVTDTIYKYVKIIYQLY